MGSRTVVPNGNAPPRFLFAGPGRQRASGLSSVPFPGTVQRDWLEPGTPGGISFQRHGQGSLEGRQRVEPGGVARYGFAVENYEALLSGA